MWALLPFRQRLFSYLDSKDQVSALVISRETIGEVCRAVYFDLDLAKYWTAGPVVIDPVRPFNL